MSSRGDLVTENPVGSARKGSFAKNEKVDLQRPSFSLEERQNEIRDLLVKIDLATSRGFSPGEMVLDRWYSLLSRHLPPTPWTAIHSSGGHESKETERLIVDVVDVDEDELTVEAQIIGKINLKGEICAHHTPIVKELNEKPHDIPFEQLQVMPCDDLSQENLKKCNTILDHFAFFKNFLWFAFDQWGDESEETEEANRDYLIGKYGLDSQVLEYYDGRPSNSRLDNSYWPERFLDFRFQIYRSHVDGENDIYRQLRLLSDEYSSLHDDLYEDAEPLLFECGKPELIVECLDIRRKMRDIIDKVHLLQCPDLRNGFEAFRLNSKRREREGESRKRKAKTIISFVWNDTFGSFDEMVENLNRAKHAVGFVGGSTVMKIKPSLQAGLDDALPGDTIVIPRGTHRMKNWGVFKNGGSIIGFDPQECIIEVNTYERPPRDEIRGYAIVVEKSVTFQNLLIKPEVPRESKGILVKSGSVMLKDCQVNEFDVSAKIMPGASMCLETVSFSMGRVGLIVENDAKVKADVLDVFIHTWPFVFKNHTGKGIVFNHVGTDFVENHITIIHEDSNTSFNDLLKDAVMTNCEELKEDAEIGLRIVNKFNEDD